MGMAAWSTLVTGLRTLEYCSGTNCTGYRGTKTKTTTGKTCQAWNTQTPNSHTFTPASKPTEDLDQSTGYCRNPDTATKTTIWCYVTPTASPNWEYCAVKPSTCDNNLVSKTNDYNTEVGLKDTCNNILNGKTADYDSCVV